MDAIERDDLSNIELTFQVNYYLPQRTAGFHTMSHTKAAEEYGVQYQLGYIEREGENPRLSPPMSIGEIKDHRFAVNILDGGALIVRMVDRSGRELAAAKIGREKWPSGETGDVITAQYLLPVPKERLL